jgi:hypothetical protein
VKPAFAAASKRSRNGTSVNIMERLAAKRGIFCPLACLYWRMIFSENRFPLFWIMLISVRPADACR